MKLNDLVLRVNGHSTAEVETFPTAHADWSDKPQVLVELERKSADGEWIPMKLRYRIMR